ncbi:4Fe-4S binding protein [Methanobrevibacter sp. TMH8]|uniref:4Fe-4S binding protein n=1 Tax=Methanobrevibacter sp. TMH8 TaxID=2848611 RepID=UPI001CCB1DE2|nr:4Fe-4S binding protein [Methanobrevibacter sp. TMH8]MBZ9571342.1 4Fe-4S binding protein [Methanobrevibacter sp. TMH8]
MEIKLKKQMKNLEKEVILKSVDLDDDIDDFEVDIGAYEADDKFITVSPRCVRCNLCFEECPVNAVSPPTFVKRAKIEDNCVKCEICAQSCPVSCIYVMETKSKMDGEEKEINYQLKETKVPHRVLRMDSILIDRTKCENCKNCIKFCPTNAITLKDKSIIEAADNTSYPYLENEKYPYIEEKLCVGCGSCANLCPNNGITLERVLGPIFVTKSLCIDQDACVQCFLCEETCPVDAIKLEGDKVILDDEKCIKCNVCSSKCPVNALSLKNLSTD